MLAHLKMIPKDNSKLCKNMIRTDHLQKKRSGMTVCKLQRMITENLMIFMAGIVLTFAQLFKVWFHIAFKTACSKYISHHSIPCNLPWPQNHGKLLQCLSDWRWGSEEKTFEGKNFEICYWPESQLLGFRPELFQQNLTLSNSKFFAFALDYHKFNLCANPDKLTWSPLLNHWQVSAGEPARMKDTKMPSPSSPFETV